jgi:hypothetical protein
MYFYRGEVLCVGSTLKDYPKDVITKLWKVVVYPIPKAAGDLIFRSREELVKTLKNIGLNDTLITLLFLRGLIELNIDGDRLLVQLIEVVERTKRVSGF